MKKGIRIMVAMIVIAVAVLVWFFATQYQATSAERPESVVESGETGNESVDSEENTMNTIQSSVDADSDGIDDQSDILQGALDYVATNPKYKSAYYTSGYPDDGYGVCTDVVAFAMKSAGYDS